LLFYEYSQSFVLLFLKYIWFRLQSKKFAGPDTDYGDLCNELGCEELSLSAEEVEEKKLEFLTSLIKSVEEIHEVERATIDQVRTIIQIYFYSIIL